jgi:hypothetical protein
MAYTKLKVLTDTRAADVAQGGIVVDEPAWIENIELGDPEAADSAATAWALVEQLEEEQLRLAAELQAERQQVARLKARVAEFERALARARRDRRLF